VTALEAVGNVFKKVFGSRNERLLKRYGRIADQIEQLEPQYRELSDEALRAKTDEFRQRLAAGQSPLDILPEAFAAVREASRRAQEHRHFHCQLIGGQVLYEAKVAEMKTGEGKTIVCHLAIYLTVLQGKKAHVVTVNDYLVKRDAEFARPIFERLGLTVGYIQAQVDPGGHEGIRQEQYACDITYGTNNEFGFDYLRDNMKMRKEDQVQGALDYAIIDEVDSILIDEARTPLIISGPARDDVSRYKWADNIARFLVRKQTQANNETAARLRAWGDEPPEPYASHPKFHEAVQRFRIDPNMLDEDQAEAIGHKQYYVVQRDRKAVSLTHDGVAAAQDEAGIGSFYVGANMECPHLIENALRAHVVYERDKDYVVQNREVIIVDEFTGRLMYGRQWSDGLHQAVEAKEGVPVKEETQTLATITIQNFFKLYEKLAGMTGTAMTESEEFMKIYRLEVVAIPTNRPVNRVDHNDKIYRSIPDKYAAIVEEIHEMHTRGRPKDAFLLADLLAALRRIEADQGRDVARIDEVLDAFHHADETDEHLLERMMALYDETMGELAMGRPILVGTTSVENSEKLSKQLASTYGIEHEVLNAKYHEREAEIVAKAGQRHLPTRGKDKRPRGNVTIATNMAGRGTDIKLEKGVVYEVCIGDLGPGEGTPQQRAARGWQEEGVTGTKCCIHCPDYDPSTNCAHCFKPKRDPRFPALGRTVCALNPPCGLHIVGTERHEARRIDNQLRGRAGRQGDPGSSRFFLSLEDDLLKLFMPDWMLRMMERLGFVEGVSLEDRRVTKGIERAQKKVEERNFSTRKHLLEWDEPMDYQRKAFYSERQRILEGRDLSRLIWRMIDESIREAVERYLATDYGPRCIAEWCRSNLELNINPSRLEGDDFEYIARTIREQARDDARDNIRTTLGEYIDPDEEPRHWDLGGLLAWAQRSFRVQLTQNQLRKMTPDQIEEALVEAADTYFAQVDLSPIRIYMDPGYGRSALASWARNKFGIELAPDEIAKATPEQAVELLAARVQAAYRQREIEYPVEVILERAYSQGGPDSAYAAEQIVRWANSKYNVGWRLEDVQGRSIDQIAHELVALSEAYMENGRLEAEIDEALRQYQDDQLIDWARNRFGPAFDEQQFRQASNERREALLAAGRQMLRWELTQLERYVLLRIYDQAWKDHLLEMDHLKHAIMQRPLGGDQTHPQSQYAIEGRDYFNQMWSRIRERVTDTIFKVRLLGEPEEVGSVYRATDMRHDEAIGAGFATAQDEAALAAQGEAAKPQTIRREQPRVGRNQPCPCGSGKKYKHCCGRKAQARV